MNFLNAGILGALALAAIPLIIHLINRRKAVDHPFAAFDFIMRSRQESVRRFRLKYILLLIIRTLIIVSVVMGAAMPVLYSRFVAGGKNAGNALVVFDNSASMTALEEGRTGFEAAVSFLNAYADRENLRSATILTICGTQEAIDADVAAGELAAKTAALAPTFYAGHAGPVLRKAAGMLAGASAWDRLLVISDFAVSDWTGVPESLFLHLQTPVLLASAYGDSERSNTGISSVALAADPSAGGEVTVRATVANNTGRVLADVPVSLYLGGKNIINGFVQAEASRGAVKEFVIDGSYESAPGYVRLPPDSFAADDARYFVYTAPAQPRILIIDGDQGIHFTAAESFFLEKALSDRRFGRNTASVTTPTGFDPKLLARTDILFVCNYVPSADQTEAIKGFVEKGGGLFVSLGDRVDPGEFNTRLAPLFNRWLRDRKTGVAHDVAQAAGLSITEPDHPAVRILSGLDEPEKYSFTNLFLLEPAPGASGATLLSLSSGEPLLVENKAGKGKVFLYLSTLDLAWNDFPLRPFFLPFLREAVQYLAGATWIAVKDTVFTGDTVVLPADAALQVDDPVGVRHSVAALAGAAKFGATSVPGLYRVPAAREGAQWFAVNMDPAECDLSRLSRDQRGAFFRGAHVQYLSVRSVGTADSLKPEPLWHWFFLFAALFALIEGLILRRS
ncbi:MAG: hypothetical protein A2268_06455 [Candidatus Raymondbacteria bacterium RifOxyA12_full_50_37]|nr:MAG: hypothetical protein A2268_06455 [Candidatus Raymondbacteria bacterium RifOxyA12_full_50_37]OGJ92669.1 MAG: hypothetical protein A2350_03970 [Candidatus Raymondbacteria bacterium RifOxyB12_full_50_8]OGJ94453.1 MAG: hypothetical protein A2248_15385 [Candidatus Raymondbacteria bacterium RIFOXYA2_FULL_49_16]OGJ99209.1 MAG: hypothetical protein A2453_07235 [Candidatus Raymondbacteria bacterium RIFOXYC2_FULL_50_21]OGP45282.1 MAG: hypothetical protein A2324_12450 [Candidatus Raymondbacteria b